LARLPYSPDFANLCDLGKIENILLPEGQDLVEVIINSLVRIEAEKLAHPKETVVHPAEKLQGDKVYMDMDASSQQVTHTGQAFSDIVVRLIQNKDNVGTFDRPNAEGYFLGSCGDRMQIHLQNRQ